MTSTEAPSTAIVGAGIVGRLMAYRMARLGYPVTLFEQNNWQSRAACSFAAAGLLTPLAEAVAESDTQLVAVGQRSMALWPQLLSGLGRPVLFACEGTLALAREPDLGELSEFRSRVSSRAGTSPVSLLDGAGIARLEPMLAEAGFSAGLSLRDEGFIQSHEVLAGLEQWLVRSPHVTCRMSTSVTQLGLGFVETAAGRESFAQVIDSRGLGAKHDLRDLRGVRGEIIEVHAPEVELTRPLRILHQRYPIYVVPRGNRSYAVGATSIESSSTAPVTVKSALELLGAVYHLHPGFRFAQITDMVANLRPAFSDHRPRVEIQRDAATKSTLMRLNGFYRHGFLLAPLATEIGVRLLNGDNQAPDDRYFFGNGEA